MMYTNNAGISYYKRGKRYFKNSGWLEREITKDEYDDAIRLINIEIKKEEQKMKQRFFVLYVNSGRRNDYDFHEYAFGTWHDVLKYMKRFAQPCYIVEQINEEGLRWRDVCDADGQPIILKSKNWH